MKTDSTYSQSGQDSFVLEFTKNKTNGTFVEIGSNHPITTNNSYLLESKYGWRGLMIEYDRNFETMYQTHRSDKTHYYIGDAQTVPYKQFFDLLFPSKKIDYLQIDLDVDNRSTLNVLELLDTTCFDEYTFATITFEHDIYRGDYFNTRELSRAIFAKRGYIRIFSDVEVEFPSGSNTWGAFEDWYVHPSLIDTDVIYKHIQNNNLHHTEITSRFTVK